MWWLFFLNFSGRDFTLFSVKAVLVYLPPVVCHGLFLLPLLHHFSLSDHIAWAGSKIAK